MTDPEIEQLAEVLEHEGADERQATERQATERARAAVQRELEK